MLGRLNRLEADERDLHGKNSTECVDSRVGDVDLVRESTGDHKHKHVKRNEVDKEDVATPRGDHVEVGQRTSGRPKHASGLHRSNPQPVGQQHAKDRNTLVIVRASDRSGNVTRDDGDETSGDETRARISQLLGEQIRDNGRERGEERSQEDADVADLHGHVEPVQNVIESRRCDHETWIDRAADDTAEWVPGAVIEPVMERVETLFREIFRRAVVEVRIELVDH